METNTTTISLDIMTVAEAANYVGVSVRTIERHVLLTKCPSEWVTRNNRKVKAYPKHWLDTHFVKSQTVGTQLSDRLIGSRIDNGIGKEKASVRNVGIAADTVINSLKEENSFLRKEMEIKTQQITSLIRSDEQTKTLLADLQFQNKTLLLNSIQTKPKQKPEERESRVWLWVGLGLSAVILTGGYFCYEYIATLLK
jgi:hypothetical protein